MTQDANTMNPGSVYTSVTNAQKAERPGLRLSGPDPRPDSDYDPEQLKAGMQVESEHCKDPAVQKFIAKDHIDEDREYYIKIKKLGL